MAYLRHLFKTYPLVSNCLIYGGLYSAAEFSQQTILKKVLKDPKTAEKPYDTALVGRYFAIGTFSISPTLYYWYKWMDKKFPGTAIKTIARKCLMDQFLMTPNILAMFYVGMSLLEGKDDLTAELKAKFVPTFIANSLFWMLTQAINFTFIPPQYRVVYISLCTLIWVNILCVFKRN